MRSTFAAAALAIGAASVAAHPVEKRVTPGITDTIILQYARK